MGLPTSRTHRTAVVIDVRAGVTNTFKERYERLLQSVGGSNIKVDVFTLRGNSTGDGPGLVAGAPGSASAPEQKPAEIDLKAWAKDVGYDQLLVVTNPKA